MTENTRVEPEALPDVTGAWTLDPRRTTIQFQTKSMWVLTVNGTLRASEGHGAVDDDGQITGRVVIDTESIDTKSKRRDAHLRGTDFFDVRKYPAMVFDVTGVRLDAPGQCTIKGTLTIRDVTLPVEFPAALRAEGDGSITIDARTEIDRSRWGMAWAMMGAGLDNHVTVEATFVRRDVA
jgi:polyisoprenoid-binding protein YceI